ncbi:hypothetical protein HDV06_007067 [Boothiomyces sp. JEL0866]|nr:hypothetical protein HDV06_007067 [Boothiomyces sp. JEL0866]
MLLLVAGIYAASFNNINFAVSNGVYTSDSCTISDSENQRLNATSATDCQTKCSTASQLLPGSFNCTSYAYSSNNCLLFDRSINLLSLFSSTGKSCGFLLGNNPYCADNQGTVTCNIPNNSGKTDSGLKSGEYSGSTFNANGDVYTLTSCRVNELFVSSTSAESWDDCISKCQSSHGNFTSFPTGCYMYDKPLNQMSFNTQSNVNGWNCGFLLSRSTQCYNSGGKIACSINSDGPQPSTTASSPSSSATDASSSSTSSSGPNLVVIIVPVVLVVLVLIGLGVYFGRSRKDHSSTFASTPITTISNSPPAATPLNQINPSPAIAYPVNPSYHPVGYQESSTQPTSNTLYAASHTTDEKSATLTEVGELPINPRNFETMRSITSAQPPLLQELQFENSAMPLFLNQQPRVDCEEQPPLLKQ